MRNHRDIPFHRSGPLRQGGFTLIEVAIATAILSIIVVGLSSAIVLATKALPSMTSPAQQTLKAADVSQRILGELRYASSITESTANALTFIVPDRNGDALPDTISYRWSAIPGDRLTRQFNTGAVVTALPDVHDFSLDYDLTDRTEMVAGEGEGAVTTLTYHSAVMGYTSASVTAYDWPGQYFTPILPADATGWRVTGVAFWAKADVVWGGEVAVQLRQATPSNTPTDTVLAEKTLSAYSLDIFTYQWTYVDLDGAARLAADEGACLVIKHLSGSLPCHVLLDGSPTGFVSDMSFVMSTDAGQNWGATTAMSLEFTVYGTYTTPDLVGDVTRTFAQRATLDVRAGDQSSSSVHSAVGLLNEPEVTDR